MNDVNSIHYIHPAVHVEQAESDRQVRNAQRRASDKSSSDKAERSSEKDNSKTVEDVALPAPVAVKSGDRDYLKELINAYCAINDSTSQAVVTQMDEFGQLQQLNSIIAQTMLFKQTEILSKFKELNKKLDALQAEVEKQQKFAEVGRIIGYVGMGIMALSLAYAAGVAIMAAYTASQMAAAGATEAGIEMATMSANAAAAEAATQAAAEAGAQAGSQAAGEAAAAATQAGAESVAEAAGEAAVEASLESASSSVEEAAAQLNAVAVKPANYAWMGKVASFLLSATMGAPQLYQGWLKVKTDGNCIDHAAGTAQILREVADKQKEIGEYQSTLKVLQGNQTFYSKESERSSSVVDALGHEMGDDTETASEIISVYGQITQGIGQRRA